MSSVPLKFFTSKSYEIDINTETEQVMSNLIFTITAKKSQIKNYISEVINVMISSIGQGTQLGPILFLIFINDICSIVKHSQLLLFSDDLKLFRVINNIDDRLLLQSDIDAVSGLCG